MNNCCVCNIETSDDKNVEVIDHDSNRSLSVPICNVCLAAATDDPYTLIDVIRAKLDAQVWMQ